MALINRRVGTESGPTPIRSLGSVRHAAVSVGPGAGHNWIVYGRHHHIFVSSAALHTHGGVVTSTTGYDFWHYYA